MVMSRLLTSGGAERVAANLASQLKNNGEEVWMLVFDGNHSTYHTDAPIIDLKMPMQKGLINKIVWYVKVIKEVSKYKKDLQITHAISFLNEPDLINVITSWRGKAIVSVRNNRSFLDKNFITKIKDKFVFYMAEKIVALSNGVKEDLVNYYNVSPSKIEVIYNACDVELIKKQYEKLPNDASDLDFISGKTVVTAGRLTKQKGQWHLIRAFKKVVEEVPDAKLLILGQGAEEEYLHNIIHDLHLENSIKLMGYQENPYYYLRKSDVFVFSSLFEGFGNVLLEAMACDLPIISTDCLVGPRELLAPGTTYNECSKDCIVKAENGILVPVCDGTRYDAMKMLTLEERTLADAIVLLLKDEALREYYCEKSRKRIKDFSRENISLQWDKVINSL